MKFQDPQHLRCPDCGAEQETPVRSLLALTARCESCDADLRKVGLQMRDLVNDWTTYSGKIEIAMALEDRFGVGITDEEIDAADSIDGFSSVVCRKQSAATHEAVSAEVMRVLSRLGLTASAELSVGGLRDLLSKYGRADA